MPHHLHALAHRPVVGPNGAGKTTFIKLICRLYDPQEGELLLNGIDIRKYSYEEYLSLLSVVFQDFRFFSMGLGENVAASKGLTAPAKAVIAPTCMDPMPTVIRPAMALRPTKA